jgi:ferredoxin
METVQLQQWRSWSSMCTGHGRCYSLAPEVFASDDEGHRTLLRQVVPKILRKKAMIGVQNCPEQAISVVD